MNTLSSQSVLKKLFTIFLLCNTFSAFADDQRANIWTKVFLNWVPKQSPYFSQLEFQERISPEEGFETSIFRLSGGYKNGDVSYWLGYSAIFVRPFGEDGFYEYNYWQQILWTPSIIKPKIISLRTRVEQKKRETFDSWGYVLREQLRFSIPICDRLSAELYDEVFVNLNNPVWENPQFINQNRIFLGVKQEVIKNTFVEVGYLNSYRFRIEENRMHHVLQATVTMNFD